MSYTYGTNVMLDPEEVDPGEALRVAVARVRPVWSLVRRNRRHLGAVVHHDACEHWPFRERVQIHDVHLWDKTARQPTDYAGPIQ